MVAHKNSQAEEQKWIPDQSAKEHTRFLPLIYQQHWVSDLLSRAAAIYDQQLLTVASSLMQ